jgi:hypothetical protein
MGFSVWLTSNTSIPNGAYTQIIFDNKLYDNSTSYSTTSGYFTAPYTGFYHFESCLCLSNVTNGILFYMRFEFSDGYQFENSRGTFAPAAYNNQLCATVSKNMTSGGTVRVVTNHQDTAARLSCSGTSNYFSGFRVF